MTAETMSDLNLNTLIGCTAERGQAWHRRDDLQGAEDNSYPGLIPTEDVKRRLFGWEPQTVPVAYLVPLVADDFEEGTGPTGPNIVQVNGRWVRIVETQADRVGVLRGDNDYDLGVFKDGVNHPSYAITLIREAERLTGTQLGISSAGLLAKGGRAWVEMSMPETLHDAKSGLDYRPNLLKADSMDGSIAMTTALTINATICDNTLTWNLLEAKTAGRLFKRKHTSNFLGDLQEERDALGILEMVDTEFVSELHALLAIELTKAQRIEVMDIIVPTEGKEGGPLTRAENKRSRLMALDSSEMVSPWLGTAFGEFQRYNTNDHWNAVAMGTTKSERNTWRTISGKRAEADREFIAAIEQVVSA